MDVRIFKNIIRKYKKCPQCGVSCNSGDLEFSLKNEIISINCKCGWKKKVDEKNREIK